MDFLTLYARYRAQIHHITSRRSDGGSLSALIKNSKGVIPRGNAYRRLVLIEKGLLVVDAAH